jgi:hypothetical protein
MTANQRNPNRRALTSVYRQAGYTIEDVPNVNGAHAATMWVSRNGQRSAVVASHHSVTKPGTIIRQVAFLSQYAPVHVVARSEATANQLQGHLRDPVLQSTDHGTKLYLQSTQFSLNDTILVTAEPHTWIATRDDQSPPAGAVLSLTPTGDETDPTQFGAANITKRSGYDSAVTELTATDAPAETPIVRTPVLPTTIKFTHDISVKTLAPYTPVLTSAQHSNRCQSSPSHTLAEVNKIATTLPTRTGTRIHLVSRQEWDQA